jgi:glc operon protein GlcG
MTHKIYTFALLVMLFVSTTVVAQDEASRMSYEQANTAMQAAEAYARQQGWNVTILVTDQNANPVMLRRLDGASVRTISIANSKALVVTKTGLTSGEYGRRLEAGEIAEIEGGVSYQGGVPVYKDGLLIGAVTASGVKGSEDEEISIAGAETIGSISMD